MANPLVQEISEQTSISAGELESIWQKAMSEAEKKKIKNKYGYATAALEYIRKSKSTNDSATQRYIDANNALICPNSVITGADVAEYYGGEIPNHDKLGLNPNQIYKVYRPIEEMKDNDFSGKYLLSKHVGDFDASTHDKYKSIIIGIVYDTAEENNQIKGTVAFYDPASIDKLEDGKKYLSAGYFYDPVLEKGQFNGDYYDIKMTNIRANHVAHVDNPRYKKAAVGDENTINKKGVTKMEIKYLTKFLKAKLGLDSDKVEEVANSMDEEEVKEAEKKAKDSLEAEKKAQDEKDEKDKADKAEDEDDKDETTKDSDCSKTSPNKGMDEATVKTLVSSAVKTALDEYKKEVAKTSVAMDSAMQLYRARFGNPRISFDSADAVYDAILQHEGLDSASMSTAEKMGVVKGLSLAASKRNVNVGMDSGGDNFDYLSAEDKKMLGVN